MEYEKWAAAFYLSSDDKPFTFFNEYAAAYFPVCKISETGFQKIGQKTCSRKEIHLFYF